MRDVVAQTTVGITLLTFELAAEYIVARSILELAVGAMVQPRHLVPISIEDQADAPVQIIQIEERPSHWIAVTRRRVGCRATASNARR